MSEVLYYSKNCEKCQKLLQQISKSVIKDKIHFVCIDNRKIKQGRVFIILENNQEIMLPPKVDRVPALLLINNNQIIFGDNIYNYLKPEENIIDKTIKNSNVEPDCFSFNGFSSSNIASDNFSFLDQNNDSMLAQGDGGLRQLYNYSTISSNQKIETPPDDYAPDTIGNVSLDKLQQERNISIK